jgi:hypothetical protein
VVILLQLLLPGPLYLGTIGHWSNGPIALAWKAGVLWFLPNHDVR